jgi:hypothetical protein
MGQNRNRHTILIGKLKKRDHFEDPWEDNINTDCKEIK